MASMAAASVFVVQHLHVYADGEEEVKMIGVYESREAAVRAVQRLATQPGFRDWPDIRDDCKSGFYVNEYEIGKDHWCEGYTAGLDGLTD